MRLAISVPIPSLNTRQDRRAARKLASDAAMLSECALANATIVGLRRWNRSSRRLTPSLAVLTQIGTPRIVLTFVPLSDSHRRACPSLACPKIRESENPKSLCLRFGAELMSAIFHRLLGSPE